MLYRFDSARVPRRTGRPRRSGPGGWVGPGPGRGVAARERRTGIEGWFDAPQAHREPDVQDLRPARGAAALEAGGDDLDRVLPAQPGGRRAVLGVLAPGPDRWCSGCCVTHGGDDAGDDLRGAAPADLAASSGGSPAVRPPGAADCRAAVPVGGRWSDGPVTTYRLLPARSAALAPPVLDEHQRSVVDHPGGPLLVLAGPGHRQDHHAGRGDRRPDRAPRGAARLGARADLQPQGRRAAARPGHRPARPHHGDHARARRSTPSPTGWCAATPPAELYAAPLRLLSAPEQDVVLAGAAHRRAASRSPGPRRCAGAVGTRGFAREVHAVLARAREKGLGPRGAGAAGARATGPTRTSRRAASSSSTSTSSTPPARIDYPDLVARAVLVAERHRDELRAQLRHVFVDEYQDTDPSQVALLQALAGDGRDLTVVGDPHQSIYAFRGAEVRGILDFPDRVPAARTAPRPTWSCSRTTRRFGPACCCASQRVAAALPLAGSIDATPVGRSCARGPPRALRPRPRRGASPSTPTAPRPSTSPTCCAGRTSRTGVDWSRDGGAGALGAGLDPRPCAARWPRPACRSRWPPTTPRWCASPPCAPLLDALRRWSTSTRRAPTARRLRRRRPRAPTALLVSPLAGLDAADVRALARACGSSRALATHGADARPSRRAASPAPCCAAGPVRDRGSAATGTLLERRGVRPCRPRAGRSRALRGAAAAPRRGRSTAGGTAEEVLWVLWSGTEWPRRLRARRRRAAGQRPGSAHRDLDAVCALFEAAARAEEQRGHTGVAAFLAT